MILLLIFTRIIHELRIYRKIGEGDSVEITHVFYEKQESCWIKHGIYQFYLSRCSSYELGEKISLIGTVEESTDKLFFQQKKLDIQSIVILQNQDSSHKDWLFLIIKPIILIKSFLLKRINYLWPPICAALIAGFVFGFDEKLPESLVNKIKVTGMQHVVVASGFNVSLVMVLVMGCLALFPLSKRYKSLITMLGIFLYSLISGLSAPLSRAVIMGMLSILAKNFFFRQYRALFGLCLAAFFMLLVRPSYFFNISFQLSTSATMGVILVYPLFVRKNGIFSILTQNDADQLQALSQTQLSVFSRLKSFFADAFFTTLSAQSLTLPLLLYHFGEFSLISLVSNTFLLWLTPIVTYAGFLVIGLDLILKPLLLFSSNAEHLLSMIAFFPEFFFVAGINYFGRFKATYFTGINFPLGYLLFCWFLVIAITIIFQKVYETD